MKIYTTLIISLFCLFCSILGCAADVSIPPMPAEFYGTVYIGNNPAPAGTTVTALLNGVHADEVTITEAGMFGGGGIFDKRLSVVAEDANSGPHTIRFLVNGISVERVEEFFPGTSKQIELTLVDANAKESASSQVATAIPTDPATRPPTTVPTPIEVQTIPTTASFISYDPYYPPDPYYPSDPYYPPDPYYPSDPYYPPDSYYPPNLQEYPEFQRERVFTSGDELAQLIMYPGSEIKTAAGSTIQLATVKRKSLTGIQMPDGLAYAGYGYELVPVGLSFLPDATFSVSIDDGLFEENPIIMRYEARTGAWMYLPSFADRFTGTVRAAITESGIYGVVIQDMTPQEIVMPTPITTEQIQTQTPRPTATTIPTTQVMTTPVQTEIPTPPAQGPPSTPQSNTIWYVAGGILLIIICNSMVWLLYAKKR